MDIKHLLSLIMNKSYIFFSLFSKIFNLALTKIYLNIIIQLMDISFHLGSLMKLEQRDICYHAFPPLLIGDTLTIL